VSVAPAHSPAAPTPFQSASGPAALAVLLVASTLTVMAGAVLVPALELIRTDLGLSATQAGMVLSAHGLSLAVASPAVGALADRLGLRRVLAGGLALYGIAGGAGALLDSYPALIATRALFGMGAAAVFLGSTAALVDLYRGEARDRVMGWRSAAISVGGLAWPLAGAALAALSWHAPFALYLAGLPLGVAALAALPLDAPPRSATAAGSPPWRALGAVRPVRALLSLQLLAAILLYAVLAFVPMHLAELGRAGPLTIAACTSALSAAMTVAGFGFAAARARYGNDGLLRAALGIWALALAGLGLTGHAAAVIAASAAVGVGMGLAVPALTVGVGAAVPSAQRGRATALLASATFAGQFAAPLLLGPVVERTSAATGFLVAAAVGALAFAWSLRAPREVLSPAPREAA
jgi:MFS family permease